jgi:hypothetical protein
MPFSFLLLDDDSRGIAQRVGPTTLDGLAVEHWQHLRVPGAGAVASLLAAA